MRTIIGKPTLTAAGDEYEEKAAQWFELFFDLVLVDLAQRFEEMLDSFVELVACQRMDGEAWLRARGRGIGVCAQSFYAVFHGGYYFVACVRA